MIAEEQVLALDEVRDDIRDRVARIYRSLAPGGAAPLESERGDLDSLSFLEFIVALESEFGIEIQTEDLDGETFATTTSTAAFVRARLARAAGRAA